MKKPQGHEGDGEGRLAQQGPGWVRDFVAEEVLGKGLDERTARAYRTDLEHLYLWLGKYGKGQLERGAVEDYLNYLVNEEGLKYSTVTRKYRVFCYYMEYLERKGIMPGCSPSLFLTSWAQMGGKRTMPCPGRRPMLSLLPWTGSM